MVWALWDDVHAAENFWNASGIVTQLFTFFTCDCLLDYKTFLYYCKYLDWLLQFLTPPFKNQSEGSRISRICRICWAPHCKTAGKRKASAKSQRACAPRQTAKPCLYLRAVVLTLTFCRKSDLSLWRWMNKCQSPVAQQSTRFLHCVTGSARKDNSTFGIVWNLCQIATWKYYGWAHIFF